MKINSITRDSYGSPVNAQAPQKIEDAVHTMVTEVIDALTEDGMSVMMHRAAMEDLEREVLGLVTYKNNFVVAKWEELRDRAEWRSRGSNR